MTGLPNRTLFLDRLDLILERARTREGEVAVLFVDLDDFQVVDDSLGYEVGDQVLLAVAERLENCMLAEETLARFGETNSPSCSKTYRNRATRRGWRTGGALREPFVLRGRERFVTTSVGISFGVRGGERPGELLRNTDLAMYRAKARGRNRHAVFEPGMGERALQRLEFEGELRRALEKKKFTLHYQPKVSLESGEIVAMEALIRWEHPARGLVPPRGSSRSPKRST